MNFLNLPKDIQHYILVHIIVNKCADQLLFRSNPKLIKEHVILWACDKKHMFPQYNIMTQFVKKLGFVHPTIRKLLKSFCLFDVRNKQIYWRFKESFFNQLQNVSI